MENLYIFLLILFVLFFLSIVGFLVYYLLYYQSDQVKIPRHGETCVSDCDTGLQCHNGVCLSIDGEECNSDSDCVNNSCLHGFCGITIPGNKNSPARSDGTCNTGLTVRPGTNICLVSPGYPAVSAEECASNGLSDNKCLDFAEKNDKCDVLVCNKDLSCVKLNSGNWCLDNAGKGQTCFDKTDCSNGYFCNFLGNYGVCQQNRNPLSVGQAIAGDSDEMCYGNLAGSGVTGNLFKTYYPTTGASFSICTGNGTVYDSNGPVIISGNTLYDPDNITFNSSQITSRDFVNSHQCSTDDDCPVYYSCLTNSNVKSCVTTCDGPNPFSCINPTLGPSTDAMNIYYFDLSENSNNKWNLYNKSFTVPVDDYWLQIYGTYIYMFYNKDSTYFNNVIQSYQFDGSNLTNGDGLVKNGNISYIHIFDTNINIGTGTVQEYIGGVELQSGEQNGYSNIVRLYNILTGNQIDTFLVNGNVKAANSLRLGDNKYLAVSSVLNGTKSSIVFYNLVNNNNYWYDFNNYIFPYGGMFSDGAEVQGIHYWGASIFDIVVMFKNYNPYGLLSKQGPYTFCIFSTPNSFWQSNVQNDTEYWYDNFEFSKEQYHYYTDEGARHANREKCLKFCLTIPRGYGGNTHTGYTGFDNAQFCIMSNTIYTPQQRLVIVCIGNISKDVRKILIWDSDLNGGVSNILSQTDPQYAKNGAPLDVWYELPGNYSNNTYIEFYQNRLILVTK